MMGSRDTTFIRLPFPQHPRHLTAAISDMSESKNSATTSVAEEQAGGETVMAVRFPEGGMQAWLTVLGGWMAAFCTFGAIQSYGVYQDYYTRVSLNEYPTSDVSWIGSIQIFFLFSLGLVSGKLFDLGYFRHLLAVGTLIYLFCSFMLSLVKPHHFYQNILAQGIGMGTGMGILFLPSLSVSAHYFRRKRGITMGIILTGSSVGAVLYPIMLNHLFVSVGFGWAIRIVSFFDLFLLVTANCIMRTRLPPAQWDGSMYAQFQRIMRHTTFWIAVFGVTVACWGLYIPIFYIQLFAAEHNESGVIENYIVAILNAVGVLGRILPMILSDIWGPTNVIPAITFISGCLVFVMLASTSTVALVVFACLYGFFSSAVVSLAAPTSASFATDVKEVGTRLGILTFVMSFALLTGNPIAGVLLHPPHYRWINLSLFSAITVIAGSILLLISRVLQRRGQK